MRKLLLSCLIMLAQSSPLWAQSAVLSQQSAQSPGRGNNAFLIATLPGSNGGTYDHMHMIATFNCNWIAACDTTLDLTMGNRNGFSAVYTAKGQNPTGYDVAIAAYQQSDGSTNVYITMADFFDVATWAVLESVQETIYSPYQSVTNVDQTPLPGTLVFNTSMAAYPPANWTGPGGSFVSVGNVGIGTAGLPLSSLQVNGTLYSTIISNSPGFASWPNNNASYNFMGAGGTWGIRTDSSYGINFDVYSNAYPRTPFYIGQNGNVGIGMISPTAQLEVNGNEKVDGSIIFPDGTSMSTAAANQNISVSNGNVGIGTTNPQAALQVASAASPLASTLQPFGNGNVVIQSIGGRSQTAGAALSFAMAANLDGSNLWEQGRVIATADTPGDSDASGRLSFQTRYINRNNNQWLWNNNLVLTSNGSVGVNTTSPSAQLEVNGNVKLTSGSGASMTYSDGTVQSTAWNGTTYGEDYAESVSVIGDQANYEPGDVIVIDESANRQFLKSNKAYSRMVAGVFSTKPGILGRLTKAQQTESVAEIPMAITGIVPTKVNTENGPIKRGDLLVSSSTPGYAMKGTDRELLLGAVIGKALAPLDSGSGIIEVLLVLQ